MPQPAARITDNHTCPMAEGPKPHVGGPIIEAGQTSVLAEFLLVGVVGATCTCVGPPDKVSKGSSTVFACNKEVARIGDTTQHGGVIVTGSSSVIVGG
jgi:uncharacterized Zn-binding protein involved in type VI secretion